METWIEEWLFRGRPPSGADSDKSPRYHIVIGKQAPDPFNPDQMVRQLSAPILSEQLEEFGFSRAALIDQFNIDALDRIAELDDQVAAKDVEMETLRERTAITEAALGAAELDVSQKAAQIAELEVQVSDLSASAAQIEAMEKHIAAAEAELALKAQAMADLQLRLEMAGIEIEPTPVDAPGEVS